MKNKNPCLSGSSLEQLRKSFIPGSHKGLFEAICEGDKVFRSDKPNNLYRGTSGSNHSWSYKSYHV